MNPVEKTSDEIHQQQKDINDTITNPLLENMGSCPYYGLNEENERQQPQKSIQSQENKAQEINPYYNTNIDYNPPFEETPVFQNTPEIKIKQKVKMPKKTMKSQHEQEYIKLNKSSNGNYSKQAVSRNESNCCNENCCDQACIHCCLQVCLTLICQLIFKR